jgi:malonate decarboxylase beta subunit
MNGPEVVEQEAGVEELDASDRPLVWSLVGGEQRYAVGLADAFVEDDVDAVAGAVREAFRRGAPRVHRSEEVERFERRLAAIDPAGALDGAVLRRLWSREDR